MITEPTVLILGAGASMPFSYPSGATLVDEICMADESAPVLRSLHDVIGTDLEPYRAFQKALRNSGRESIDSFLEHNPSYIEMGKMAIAIALIQRENEPHLFQGRNWYKTLFNHMNASLDEFTQNQLAIITYNYDRSLEHFLVTALFNAYESLDYENAVQLVEQIPIIHLHGQLGQIPRKSDKAIEGERAYRRGINAQHLVDASRGIRIIHEDIGKDSIFLKARELINRAHILCFLGFGYDVTNLERLDIKRLSMQINNVSHGHIFGTTLGLGNAKSMWVKKYINGILLHKGDIDSLLAEHQILFKV